ncbi:phosphohistidine phosphatase [Cardiosporidium cionae]|uniref:Phosphohistidine phosphatase n=1 Tax=Cardiosporidium cionae TaxID=476202 RepID=A0ABQ7J9S4_9APIC|nr:phosphohistidine phosphatase [Cardiosporidium cionae]|eukprot:KAF8820747.1 phosphohistidine phosphatase [Cardiosporidium cionae]
MLSEKKKDDESITERDALITQLQNLNEAVQEAASSDERAELEKQARDLTAHIQRIAQADGGNDEKLTFSAAEGCQSESTKFSSSSQKSQECSSNAQHLLRSIPKVQIDEGTFKYVLLHVPETDTYLVRGNASAQYHYECAVPTLELLSLHGIKADVLGGGRIKHSAVARTIDIFGFSYSYGMADHSMVAEILRIKFGNEYTISVRNNGY